MSHSRTLDLALVQHLPADPAEAEATRSKAADLVEDFVRSEALSALDTMLTAAEEGTPGDPAVAEEAGQTSLLVDAEVARFRALADRRHG